MSLLNINPEKEPIPASWVPRVITGGKEPPDGTEGWLRRLPLFTVFIAGATNGAQAKCWRLIWKGEQFCLLEDRQFETEDYFSIDKFCWYHPDYEILGHNPPKEEEPNNEHGNERNPD